MKINAFSPYKFLNHFDKFLALAKGKDIIPVMVELDLVNFCNHNCVWCSDQFHSPTFLEKEFVFRLLQEFKSIGIKSVLFKGGGEPLLHINAGEILKFCKMVGLKSAIISNFSSTTKQTIKTILDCCEGIRVSLDATNKEDYVKVHSPRNNHQSFDKVIDNIDFLVKNKKDKNFLIGINFCLYENFKCATEAVRLGKKLGVDYIGLRKVLFVERFFGVQKENENEEIAKEFQKSEKLGEKLGIPVLVDAFRGQEIKQKFQASECLATPLSAIICANRHVYPCCALRYVDEFDFGEIRNSFLKVWKGEQREKVLEKISKLKCAKFCGFRYNYYNEILRYLRISHKTHGDFI